MYARKKGVNKRVVVAIVLVVLIAVAAASIILLAKPNNPSAPTVKVGVRVGDYFTYSLRGTATGPVPDTISSDFTIYNDTSYFKVTVTGINGTKITLDTEWALKNGTTIPGPQTIDLASGILGNNNGFYALYPADMSANQTIYPHLYRNVWINGTEPTQYNSGPREANYYSTSEQIYYTQDPTHSTYGSVYTQINFDKATGMLTDLFSETAYNNPQLETTITWSLSDTNAWPY